MKDDLLKWVQKQVKNKNKKNAYGHYGQVFLNNEERVVSLVHKTPTGPPLHPYQIWKQSTEE